MSLPAAAIALACLLVGALAGATRSRWHRRRESRPASGQRILLPFTGSSISRRAFEAAVRIALAEGATIVPAFLARVPRHLPLEASLPAQATEGMGVAEAIEQRATMLGVAVDSRVGRGRTYRDALQRLLEEEPADRVIVSATAEPQRGLSADDLRWLLERVPAEVLILRPAPADERRISLDGVRGHF